MKKEIAIIGIWMAVGISSFAIGVWSLLGFVLAGYVTNDILTKTNHDTKN